MSIESIRHNRKIKTTLRTKKHTSHMMRDLLEIYPISDHVHTQCDICKEKHSQFHRGLQMSLCLHEAAFLSLLDEDMCSDLIISGKENTTVIKIMRMMVCCLFDRDEMHLAKWKEVYDVA